MRRFVLARNRLLVSRLTFPFGRSITLINDLDTPTPYRLQYRSLERLLERGCGETTARGPVGTWSRRRRAGTVQVPQRGSGRRPPAAPAVPGAPRTRRRGGRRAGARARAAPRRR